MPNFRFILALQFSCKAFSTPGVWLLFSLGDDTYTFLIISPNNLISYSFSIFLKSFYFSWRYFTWILLFYWSNVMVNLPNTHIIKELIFREFLFPWWKLNICSLPPPSLPCFHSYHFIKKQINGLPINPVYWLFYLCELMSCPCLGYGRTGMTKYFRARQKKARASLNRTPQGTAFQELMPSNKGSAMGAKQIFQKRKP